MLRLKMCWQKNGFQLPYFQSIVRTSRSGMTIIEVLIATAMTLLIMLALAQGFKTLNDGVTAGRAKLVGSDQLRSLVSLMRSDLEGLTVDTSIIPQKGESANGYFEYYDGPLSDSTAMLFNYIPTPTLAVENRLSASRWGDIDDVLMFTSKAKEGEWFRGRIPLGLMKVHMYNIGIWGPGDSIVASDWQTDVSIASEFAEVVWFMRPLNALGTITSTELPTAAGTMNAPYLDVPPPTPVIDEIQVVDRTIDGILDPDGMPDRVALCRRTLLIRPDLQISIPSGLALSSSDAQATLRPLLVSNSNSNSNAFNYATFRYMMRFPYQRCDLSVRFALDPAMGYVLVANSLPDLQRPENRFAHYVKPLNDNAALPAPISGLIPASTLPILALTDEATSTGGYLALTGAAYGNISASPIDGAMSPDDRGFIPAAFFRTKISVNGAGVVTAVEPTLEEVVASNVVAFDVRAFDVSAKQLISPGPDGAWGTVGVNDDGLGAVDDPLEAGYPGTDDAVVGPSDPGYANLIAQLDIDPVAYPLVPANKGAYTDLSWSRRVVNQLSNAGGAQTLGGMSHFANPSITPAAWLQESTIWGSVLSGFTVTPMSPTVIPVPIPSHIRAGRYSIPMAVYQPVFDTFTDQYERDGDRQWDGIWANGLVRYGLPASASNPDPDAGTDGVDYAAPGIGFGILDDESENETSPPFAYHLPSIQVKFRVQDVKAATLQEMSMVHDLLMSK